MPIAQLHNFMGNFIPDVFQAAVSPVPFPVAVTNSLLVRIVNLYWPKPFHPPGCPVCHSFGNWRIHIICLLPLWD